MEIVRRGPEDNVECNKCGSLIKVEATDIHVDDCGVLHHYDPSYSYYIQSCPACGGFIALKASDIPDGLRHAVDLLS